MSQTDKKTTVTKLTPTERFIGGIKNSGASNWLTEKVDEFEEWSIGEVAEGLGQAMADRPDEIVQEIDTAVGIELRGEGIEENSTAKEIIKDSIKIDPEDGFFTRFKKGFASVALSFGLPVLFHIGINVGEKHTGWKLSDYWKKRIKQVGAFVFGKSTNMALSEPA